MTESNICNKICQACAEQINNLDECKTLEQFIEIKLESNQSQSISIKSLYNWIISQEMTPDDIFSDYVCKKCLKCLLDCYLFKIQCLKSIIKFQSITNLDDITKNPNNSDLLNFSFDLSIFNSSFISRNDISNEENVGAMSKNVSSLNPKTDEEIRPEVTVENEIPVKSDTSDCRSNSKQDNKETFVCNICGKTLQHQATLKRHLIRHGNNKKFECTICNRNFYFKGELEKHMIHHKKYPKFVCNFCGGVFTRLDTLKAHNKIHLNIKAHTCTYCSKSFVNKYNLENHIRVHTKELPYKCTYCDKKFNQRSYMNKHIKTHKKRMVNLD